jgi:hypothetical protein
MRSNIRQVFRWHVLCFAMFCPLLGTGPSWAEQPVMVATPEALADALRTIGPGTEVLLAPGDYGGLSIKGLAGSDGAPVTLRAADPARPPVFTGMDLRDAAHVVFEDVVFDYTFTPGDPIHHRPFQISGGSDVTIRNALFDGDHVGGVSSTDDGFGNGYGLGIRGVTGVMIEGSEIRDFARGIVVTESRDITLRGNDLNAIRSDGIDLVQVVNVLIEANYIHDFERSAESGDHADMIQFWTSQTTARSEKIVIRGNLLNSGRGLYTQSIFMRNELVDQGLAGAEMFYRDVTIEENVIINAHTHGISVGETIGLVIANNTLIRNPASAGKPENEPLWTPQIHVAQASQNVAILRNAVYAITGKERQRDWQAEDNLPIQDVSRIRAWFYDTVFMAATTGDPRDISSFGYLPGGPLDGTGIGASWLGADMVKQSPFSRN